VPRDTLPIMFGRRASQESTAETTPSTEDPRAPKGRPTPSRKEAEAARQQGLRTPRGTKEGRQAARERERAERARARQGMLAGDERYMPVRDRGPVRRYTRDFVDSRFTIAEFFIFIAVAVLVLGFIPNPQIQSMVSLGFFVLMALIVVDTAILLLTLNSRLKKEFPDKAERKGVMLYAFLRSLQFRRLRLPPPRVRRGGKPPATTT
jgi:hypothetical protein